MKHTHIIFQFSLILSMLFLVAPLGFSIRDNSGVQVDWPEGDLGGTDGAGHRPGDDFDDDFDNPFGESFPPEGDPFGDEPRPGHIPPILGGDEDPGDKPEPKPGGGGGSGGGGGGWAGDDFGGLPLLNSKENLTEKEKKMRKNAAMEELFSPGHTVKGNELLPDYGEPMPENNDLPESEQVGDDLQPINVLA